MCIGAARPLIDIGAYVDIGAYDVISKRCLAISAL